MIFRVVSRRELVNRGMDLRNEFGSLIDRLDGMVRELQEMQLGVAGFDVDWDNPEVRVLKERLNAVFGGLRSAVTDFVGAANRSLEEVYRWDRTPDTVENNEGYAFALRDFAGRVEDLRGLVGEFEDRKRELSGIVQDLNAFTGRGTVFVRSSPKGAKIFIDGEDTGKVTPSRVEVRPGRHSLVLQKDGYEASLPVSFSVEKGEDKSLSVVRLKRGKVLSVERVKVGEISPAEYVELLLKDPLGTIVAGNEEVARLWREKYPDVEAKTWGSLEMLLFADLGLKVLQALTPAISKVFGREVIDVFTKQGFKNFVDAAVKDPIGMAKQFAQIEKEQTRELILEAMSAKPGGKVAAVTLLKESFKHVGFKPFDVMKWVFYLSVPVFTLTQIPQTLSALVFAKTEIPQNINFALKPYEERVSSALYLFNKRVKMKDKEGALEALAEAENALTAYENAVPEIFGTLGAISFTTTLLDYLQLKPDQTQKAIDAVKQIHLDVIESFKNSIKLEKKKLEEDLLKTGSIKFSTEQVGMTVKEVQTNDLRTMPAEFENLSVGKHKFVFFLKGYVGKEIVVDIKEGENPEQEITLEKKEEPVEPLGDVLVSSNVDEGLVFLNDQPYGKKVNEIIYNVPEGSYVVRIENTGFVSEPREVEVKPGERVDVFIEQRKGETDVPTELKKTGTALLTLTVDQNVKPIVDTVPEKYPSSLWSWEFAEGTHKIEIYKAGYKTEVIEFEAKAGDVKRIDLKLEKEEEEQPPEEELVDAWRVDVTANVTGAKIIINDEFTEKYTPDVFYLGPGTYTFRIEKIGFIPYEETLILEEF